MRIGFLGSMGRVGMESKVEGELEGVDVRMIIEREIRVVDI